MSQKISHEQALSGLINALDHAISKGAFTREQVAQLDKLIAMFSGPQIEEKEELAVEAAVDNQDPKDPSKRP